MVGSNHRQNRLAGYGEAHTEGSLGDLKSGEKNDKRVFSGNSRLGDLKNENLKTESNPVKPQNIGSRSIDRSKFDQKDLKYKSQKNNLQNSYEQKDMSKTKKLGVGVNQRGSIQSRG